MSNVLSRLFLSLLVLGGVAGVARGDQLPMISAELKGANIEISWPGSATDMELEMRNALNAAGTWQGVETEPVLVGNVFKALLQVANGTRFYRLVMPPPALPSTNFAIGDYELVSSTAVDFGLVEKVYTAAISNWSSEDVNASATLSASAQVTVTQGSLKFGEVAAGGTVRSTNTFTIRVPTNAVLDLGALNWTVKGVPLAKTSFSLIDAALQAGTINSETALVYKIYAEMDEELLPAAYRGRSDALDEGRAIMDLEDRYETLSVETRQLLAPFLMQPNTPGSWYDRKRSRLAADRVGKKAAVVWDHIDCATAWVRIWWDIDTSPVEPIAIAHELDAKIWPKLTGLLGEPKPDIDHTIMQPDGTFIVDELDDSRLDIFITESGRTFTRGGPCGGNSHAGFINLGVQRSFSTVAHELTHAILYRFPLKTGCSKIEYKWLHEATANWAKHFVYPDLNAEWDSAPRFLDIPEKSLDYVEPGPGNVAHAYGAYLWFLFLTEGADSGAHFVRETWDSVVAFDGRGAVEQSIRGNGGYDKVWPQFALYNWNRGINDAYRYYFAWDKLEDRAKEKTPEPIKPALKGKPSATYLLDHDVPNLAAQYFHYDFKADFSIRSLTFRHPYSEGLLPTAHVFAIVKLAGRDWNKAEDWTPFPVKKLCRDATDQNFEELVIVISNSEYKNKNGILGQFGNAAELEVSEMGCDTWQGVIHNTRNSSLPGASITMTLTANVVFEFDEETTGNGNSGQFYRLQSGTYTYEERFTSVSQSRTCTEVKTSSGALPTTPYQPGVSGTSANIAFFEGPGTLMYFGGGFSILPIHTVDGCANPEKITDISTDLFWWPQSSGTVSADGKTLEGSKDTPDGLGGVFHTDWKLQKR